MIRFVKFQNKSQVENAAGLWYLRVKNGEQLSLEDIAAHMAAHNTPFSKGAVVGILTDMVACIKEQLLEGKTVKLADLVIFSLGVHSKGATRPEDVKATSITKCYVKARGTGQMSTQTISAVARAKELDYYSVNIADTPAAPSTPATGE